MKNKLKFDDLELMKSVAVDNDTFCSMFDFPLGTQIVDIRHNIWTNVYTFTFARAKEPDNNLWTLMKQIKQDEDSKFNDYWYQQRQFVKEATQRGETINNGELVFQRLSSGELVMKANRTGTMGEGYYQPHVVQLLADFGAIVEIVELDGSRSILEPKVV